MSILVKIYFFGLIAFVERSDPHRLVALLPETSTPFVTSTGQTIPQHIPILVSRADRCEGDCGTQATERVQIASALFPAVRKPNATEQMNLLGKALRKGGSWKIEGLDIEFSNPDAAANSTATLTIVRDRDDERTGPNPRRPSEIARRSSFDRVPDLAHLGAKPLTVDPRLLESVVPPGILASRLALGEGTIKAFRLARFGDQVLPWRLENPITQSASPATDQMEAGAEPMAVAVVAEIRIPSCSVKIDARPLASKGARRSMTLSSKDCENGEIEIAVLNLPSVHVGHVPSASPPELEMDHHFELYYELAECRPSRAERNIPTFRRVRGGIEVYRPESKSDFLDALKLEGRGIMGQTICISAQFGQ